MTDFEELEQRKKNLEETDNADWVVFGALITFALLVVLGLLWLLLEFPMIAGPIYIVIGLPFVIGFIAKHMAHSKVKKLEKKLKEPLEGVSV